MKDVQWIDVATRLPTEADARNRMRDVWWLVCDGYVCEPYKARWNYKPWSSCEAVAWMPIPPHPKWYPAVIIEDFA